MQKCCSRYDASWVVGGIRFRACGPWDIYVAFVKVLANGYVVHEKRGMYGVNPL